VVLDFADADGKLTGRQTVSITLAIHPRVKEQVANIDGLDPRIVAYPRPSGESQPIVLQSYPADDGNPLATGIWRAYLTAQEVDLSVSRLSRLQGELIIYPNAKRITLDLPMAAKLPVVRESGGVRCALKQLRFRGDTLTLSVETEWGPTVSATRVNPDSQDGFVALTKAGTTLTPRRESMSPLRRDGQVVKEFALAFSEVKEVPATLRLELLVRSGSPKRIPFTLPDLLLPDVQDLEAELERAEGTSGPLTPDHPLYSAEGGTLLFKVPGAGVDVDARLLVGLSRKEAQGYGAWRWLEAPVDRAGSGALGNIRPGHYRVALRWAGGMPEGVLPEGRGKTEVEVVAGKAAQLPPISPGGRTSPGERE
jgi:hypothetical protein